MFIWSKNAFLAVLPPEFWPSAKIRAGEKTWLACGEQIKSGFGGAATALFFCFWQAKKGLKTIKILL